MLRQVSLFSGIACSSLAFWLAVPPQFTFAGNDWTVAALGAATVLAVGLLFQAVALLDAEADFLAQVAFGMACHMAFVALLLATAPGDLADFPHLGVALLFGGLAAVFGFLERVTHD